jgi:hypothetical protein
MTGYFPPQAAQSVSKSLARGRRLGRVLRFGPSMVSLSALIWAAPALAQTAATTVSNSTTTPLLTSQAGNITISPGVSVKPPSGAAVTIDSNNTVANSGIIQFQNLDNVTGILALGGHTSNIDNTGTIQVDDTSTTTTDSNGIVHGPFANGTARYGIRLTGPGAFTGDVVNESVGVINVKGNGSAGISVETALTGALNNGGAINITGSTVAGNSSYGIHATGPIGGNVTIGGTISGAGEGVQGVNLSGDVGGAVVINGSVATSGYRYTTRPTDANIVKQLGADDLLQSGASVTIGGSVAKGVLVDAAVTDVLGNVTGATGTISSIAAAPALVVGAANKAITLGNVGTGVDAFGLEIKGTVSGAGTYDGVTGNGVQLGVATGAVDTTGGVRVTGSVVASSFAADATAFHINSGVTAPVFRNEGGITGALLSDAQGTTAYGIVIESGANVTALQNANNITAQVAGQTGAAVAIVDRSGTLSEVENIGAIAAGRTLTDPTKAVTGHDVALDLHLNQTGVHLLQDAPTDATVVPAITGAVSLGSGADRVEILAGTLKGDLDLGAGANSLTIQNGASVTGALLAKNGTVALTVGTVGAGTLQINNASQLKLTSLNLGAGSSLMVTADPSVGLATNLDVAGTANIAAGTKIGLRLASIQQGTTTYTLIRAHQLNSGATDVSLLGSVPYLYNASLQTNAAAGTISATLGLKSAAQLALPTTTAGAYQAVMANVGRDKALEGALLIQTDRTGLINLYNQLLPNHSGSVFNIVSASIDAFSKPLDDRQDPVGGGFWVQETNIGVFSSGKTDDPGYKGWSFGAVGGYEIPKTALGILGVTFGASTNQLYPDNTDSAEDLHATVFEGGVYWRTARGPFSANVRLAGDYVKVTSDRVVEVLGGDGLAVSRTAAGRWNAYGINAHAMASYEGRLGRKAYFRPQASLDYIRFSEGSYSETGGGDGMNLAVASRTSSRLSAFAGVAVGTLYGPDRSWGPEALLGYRAVISETLGDTNARYVAGGDPFTLRADNISGSGPVAHLSLKGENGSGGFSVGAGAENRDGLNIYDLRLTGHVQF